MAIVYPLPHSDPDPRRDSAITVESELAALMRAGCEVRFISRREPGAFVIADVVIKLPGLFSVPPGDELRAVGLGMAPTGCLLLRWSGEEYGRGLVKWLHEARLMVERKRI